MKLTINVVKAAEKNKYHKKRLKKENTEYVFA